MDKNYSEGLKDYGKEKFDFDYDLEKIIYMHLWHEKIKKKDFRRLDKEVQFDTYSKWKDYVENKYKDKSKEDLEDFSRHLNQEMRNNQPVNKCWEICIPILISMLVSQFSNFIIGYQGFDGNIFFHKILEIVILVSITIVVAIFFVYLFYKISKPIWDGEEKCDFLEDYKEIIDHIISQK